MTTVDEGHTAGFSRRLGQLAYWGGGLAAYHRARNGETLTVAMFHRVLAATDPRYASANPTWTVSAGLFTDCLDFFARHFHVVGLPQVLAASRHKPLPPRALLLTFDDGWGDNAEYALEPLQQRRMPAVVFVIAGSIDGDECWQEPLLRAWSEGRLSDSDCRRAWHEATGRDCSWTGMDAFVVRLAGLPDSERKSVLAGLRPAVAKAEASAMLTAGQLAALAAAGIEIQSHGVTHLPLAMAVDLNGELEGSKHKIAAALGMRGTDRICSLSFPHGSYNPEVLGLARRSGYRLLFSSDAVLNVCPNGSPASGLLGRIPMIGSEIVGPGGRLDASRLARWLFIRPRAALCA